MIYNDLINKYELNSELAKEIAEGTLYARILVHEAGHLITSLEFGRYIANIALPSKSALNKDNNVEDYLQDTYENVPSFYVPRHDYPLLTPTDMEEEIAICYAGKVAEEIVFGDFIKWFYSDIKRATSLIKAYLNEGFDGVWINVDELPMVSRDEAIKSLQSRCRLKCRNVINTYLGFMLKFVIPKMYGAETIQIQSDSMEYLVKSLSSRNVKGFNGLNNNTIS